MINSLFLPKVVKLRQCSFCPGTEHRTVLKKVDKYLLFSFLHFTESSQVIFFAEDPKNTIFNTLDSGGSRPRINKCLLPKGLCDPKRGHNLISFIGEALQLEHNITHIIIICIGMDPILLAHIVYDHVTDGLQLPSDA
jgi:hypothetical protein